MTFSEIIDEILKHKNCSVDTSLIVIGESHLFCKYATGRIDALKSQGINPSKNHRANLDKEIAIEILQKIKSGDVFPINKK